MPSSRRQRQDITFPKKDQMTHVAGVQRLNGCNGVSVADFNGPQAQNFENCGRTTEMNTGSAEYDSVLLADEENVSHFLYVEGL
jgi:hypothetical protein